MRFFVGLPVLHRSLAARQRGSRIKDAPLVCFFVRLSLIRHLFSYRFRIFPNRVYVISLAPIFAVSICVFHFSPFLIRRALPFQIPHEYRNAPFGGIATRICTGSGHPSPSILSAPFHSQSFLTSLVLSACVLLKILKYLSALFGSKHIMALIPFHRY